MSTSEELAAWDASETAARVRSGDVTASEVLEAAIARAQKASNLGGLVTPTFERARSSLARLRGPLAGVPTLIKDLAQLKGVLTRWGSGAAGDYVSKTTEPFVTRFESTGVVSLGKSATPEFGLTATTEPVGMDPCRNPWDRAHSSGGSSGGSGALVAAGVVPLAHGSDGGGSIRIPASCCGLVGLKPSRHRMDMLGSNLLPVNVAVDGCLSRTVRDTVLFFEAMESAAPPKKLAPIGKVAAAPERPLRIGVFVKAPLGTGVHADHREAALAAGRNCEALGHNVEEIDCPFPGSFSEDFVHYWAYLAWLQSVSARVMLHWGFDSKKLEPWTIGLSRHFSSQRWVTFQAIRRLRQFERSYAAVMDDYDVLISPTTAAPPPKLGYLATDLPFETAFERLIEYVPFTAIMNASGAPAISLPLGRSSGLPVGVQFAAAWGQDRTLLELARSVETAHPWPRTAPPSA